MTLWLYWHFYVRNDYVQQTVYTYFSFLFICILKMWEFIKCSTIVLICFIISNVYLIMNIIIILQLALKTLFFKLAHIPTFIYSYKYCWFKTTWWREDLYNHFKLFIKKKHSPFGGFYENILKKNSNVRWHINVWKRGTRWLILFKLAWGAFSGQICSVETNEA